MKKLVERTRYAERYASRRFQAKKQFERHMEDKDARLQQKFHAAERAKIVKESKKMRKEDWELGPLAPRRDVGKRAELFATVRAELTDLPPKPHKEKGPEATDETLHWLFKGDRVVIIQGRDKGKIGEAIKVDWEKEAVTIKGLNLVDTEIPEWARDPDRPTSIRTVELPIPISNVRLVYPIPDPETGIVRDVIISRLERREREAPVDWETMSRAEQRRFKLYEPKKPLRRFIPGMEFEIPLPLEEDVDDAIDKNTKEHPDDTLRIDSEEPTFTPTLISAPMPPSVIDELRNKYSKFRDRHDELYVDEQAEKDRAEEEKIESVKLMRTPMKEYWANEKAKRLAEPPKVLTPEMLSALGAAMAEAKGRIVRAAQAS